MISLRAYQTKGVLEIREAFSRGVRRVCYVAPTGSGKTQVFSYIAEQAQAKGRRVLILVHRRELLNQASDKLTAAGVTHGIIGGGYQLQLEAGVQVASVQSLVNMLGHVIPPDIIIADECHHISHGSAWASVVNAYPNARLLGVTATPIRLDGKPLSAFFDQLILGPTMASLLKMGFITPARYYAPTRPNLDTVRVERGDYARAELEAVMNKPSITGDAIKHYQRLSDGKPALAFCTSVAHAHATAAAFSEAGYRAAALDGTMKPDIRARLIGDLGSGRLQVLTNCQLITEGTDIAGVHTGIILRPTASLGLHLQILGRMLRLAPGKPFATILDHAGNVVRHGLADEERAWTLDGKKRFKKAGESSISVKVCENCYAAQKSSVVCSFCGFVFPKKERTTKEVEGELAEITARRAEALKVERARELSKATTLAELQALAKRRGYKSQWALHVLKSRRGRK